MGRRAAGLTRLLALVAVCASGCATIRPLAVEEQLARPESAIHHGQGQRIVGYFDSRGAYRPLDGWVRCATPGTLELVGEIAPLRAIELPADSLHTVMVSGGGVNPAAVLLGLGILAGIAWAMGAASQ